MTGIGAHGSHASRRIAFHGGVSAALVAALFAAGCAGSVPRLPEWEPVPVPPAEEVESVVLLIGDPGKSLYQRAPVLEDATREVERWAAALGRQSAVAVVYLGDLVYPEGLHPPDHPDFPRDSLYVKAELDVVDGPAAREHGAAAYFVAGNHDWGEARDVAGARRLRNLEEFLERASVRLGVNAVLLPSAGHAGPGVVDLGRHLRMILLDTAWWLLDASPDLKLGLLERIQQAMVEAGGRNVMLVAHHPWQTAGQHGGTVSFWEAFGLRWFLHKTGTVLQDINSRPMKDLRLGLETVFSRVGPPLIFAGGHDHSLQVIEGPGPDDPDWTLVSGTGVKVTEVGHVPGMRFRAAKAGYMTLLNLANGDAILYVRGAPEEWVQCPNRHHADVDECMAAARDAFDTLYSVRITPESDDPGG